MDPPTYGEQLAEASFNGDVSALCNLGQFQAALG